MQGGRWLMTCLLSATLLHSFRQAVIPRLLNSKLGKLSLLMMDVDTAEERYQTRFRNVGRLYGPPEAQQRLRAAHICVIGLGGVGSWVVEALARSGVGTLTLIDADDVCESNVNRQIMATTASIGKFKADALRDRVLDINPTATVHVLYDFVRPTNVLAMLTVPAHRSPESNETDRFVGKFDYVVDAADGVGDKAAILDTCRLAGMPVVTSGGVGGLIDPTLIAVNDLTQVTGDNLLMRVRRKLRDDYGYPKVVAGKQTKRWRIFAAHTLPTGSRRDAPVMKTDECALAAAPAATSSFRACDGVMGNACFATGTVGFVLASVVVNNVAQAKSPVPKVRIQRRPISMGLDGMNESINSSSSPRDGRDGSHKREGSGKQSASRNDGKAVASDPGTGLDLPPVDPERFEDFVRNSSIWKDSRLFDAHCHLQLDPLYADHHSALGRAIDHGFVRIAVCGTCMGEDWDRVAGIHQQYPGVVLPSFGLHPWWIARYLQEEQPWAWIDRLRSLLTTMDQAGVGECGLDKAVKNDVSMEMQVQILDQHLAIAREFDRTVTIHCVSGSWPQLLNALTTHSRLVKETDQAAVILHSCNSLPVEMLSSLVAKVPRIYFSISGRHLNDKVARLIRQIPRDRLLVESDAPDQLPRSLRGQFARNEPVVLKWSVYELARELNMFPSQLAEVTTQNAMNAFSSLLRDKSEFK